MDFTMREMLDITVNKDTFSELEDEILQCMQNTGKTKDDVLSMQYIDVWMINHRIQEPTPIKLVPVKELERHCFYKSMGTNDLRSSINSAVDYIEKWCDEHNVPINLVELKIQSYSANHSWNIRAYYRKIN